MFAYIHRPAGMLRELIAITVAIAFLFLGVVHAQEIQRIGSPLVQQYTKSEYKAGNQNWAVATGKNGIMYVANADGLLVFDGQYWTVHHLPNKSTIRSVAVDSAGRIYTGGLAEFGFWEDSGYGQMQYHSVSGLLGSENQLRDEIWKIVIDGDRVFFQSFSTLYRYENNDLRAIKGRGEPFLFLHHVRGRTFIELIPSGLHELQGDTLVPVRGKDVLGGANILTMLPFGEDEVLIGTAKSGLFRMDSASTIRKWHNAADGLLQTAQLNNGLRVLGHYYAFGTILQGVVIVNEAGHIVQHLHKGNGLQNNTVLGIHTDQQQNIWVGLDNGIDRIEINAPIYYYADKSGSIGTVYTARIFDGNIYLGTNQGLFYSRWPAGESYAPFAFTLVGGSQGQVWDLTEVDGELLCGHNDGTYKVLGNKLVPLSSVTGGWSLRQLPNRSDRMLQGTYTGLAVFSKAASGWQFSHRISGYSDPSQFIEPVSATKVWASGYQGLRLLTLDDELTRVQQVQVYDSASGLPRSTFTNVFGLAGSPVFATDSGFYRYDDITDRFYAYDQLNEQLGSFASSNKVIHADSNRYWFINHAHIALVHFGQKGLVQVDSMQFATLNGRMMNFYENINRVKDQVYLISLDDGFAIYQAVDSVAAKPHLPLPLIRTVSNITDSLSSRRYTAGAAPEIPYRHNNIRISYALPWYSAIPLRYQFYLEGYSRTWSEWNEAAQKEFTNLRQGNYVFKVRAMAPDGTRSGIAEFRFTILPPWYLSWIALVVYAVLFVLLLVAGRDWYRRKIQKHRELIQANMDRKQREALAKETEENEQRLMKLKNEQLERELAGKNRELANTAMSIVYKNELLNNVHDELLQLRDGEGRKLSNDQLRKINKIIEDARSDERDWNVFEESFNEAHENFFKKLKTDHPELVPNDLKLCAYLRMNMSSKEIASLLNITTRGVEIRRYRLRKKLNIPHEKNLTEFLLEL
ncbi:triple tyrosine motif-containing protein [Parapedobacter koreensis]|uniref:Y_Y_Y domain-containing protein n=1 Tax=Parapedobacter koreensis TaxID=332977 RepID=A0A1H7GUD3_9SPHI|nr:triple tyrosine motif-containing protein [Parapedobacter koreensis]SEK41087.1 Y_Y_Y domain-containing protein [Parapedobacter koreensis]